MASKEFERIKQMFGTPCKPETKSIYKTRIKKVSPTEYISMVRFSFFGRWRHIHWHFYDQQNYILTKCRASAKSEKQYKLPTSYIDAIELIEDYKKYKGSGITIW